MPNRPSPRSALAAAAAAAVLASPAAADNRLSFGLGAALTPDYLGSDDTTTRPIPLIQFESERFNIRSSGLGVEAGLLNVGPVTAGPVLRYNMGRDPDDIESDAVAALDEIDGTIELGGFVEAGFPLGQTGDGLTLLTARFELLGGASGGHDGVYGSLSTGVARQSGPLRLGANVFANFADENYMDTFFGVPLGSPSGLAPFAPESGLYEAGVGVFGNYAINERISGQVFARYSVLQGDAADSPIVADEGSDEQFTIGAGISYNFN